MWQRLRSIVEDAAASQAADLFAGQFPRFSDAWEGLKWLLARTPNLKESLRAPDEATEYRLYVCAGDILAGTPDIWIVYSFTDDEVVIHGLHAKAKAVE